jgi:hypothetical protein
VSTGNWTRQTVEESLDLAWSIEVDSAELAAHDGDHASELAERCADVKPPGGCWVSSRACSTCACSTPAARAATARRWRPGTASPPGLPAAWLPPARGRASSTTGGSRCSNSWCRCCGPRRGRARNYLAMGSGFFEAAADARAGQLPTVLAAIVAALRGAGLLTASATVDVFVNPLACQGVAGAVGAIGEAGWSVRPAAAMEAVFGRHARQPARQVPVQRPGAQQLGGLRRRVGVSGLRQPHRSGFRQPDVGPRRQPGGRRDLRARGLEWPRGGRRAPATLVTNLLPLQWDDEFSADAPPAAGTEMPEPGEARVAPPVAWLVWAAREAGWPAAGGGPAAGRAGRA